MKQKVALARALAVEPKVLFMDEPFASLDEISRYKLNDELLRVQNELGITIILVTHSINEAVYLSDKVVLFSKRPASIQEIKTISFKQERNAELRESQEFQKVVRCIRKKLDAET